MKMNPVNKDDMAVQLESMRLLFNKSLALRNTQPIGTVLTYDMLTVKKPGTGIPARELEQCVGRRLKHTVTADRVLQQDDLEDK